MISSRLSPSVVQQSLKREASSAASAANAAIDHVNSWVNGTPEGDWTSAAVVSDGPRGSGRDHFVVPMCRS